MCENKNIWAQQGSYDGDQVILLSFVWLEKRIVSKTNFLLEKNSDLKSEKIYFLIDFTQIFCIEKKNSDMKSEGLFLKYEI